jgi:hypothetical protein
MRNYGRGAVSDFLGDRVVYRNLEPADPRLPARDKVARQIGLPAGSIPRKSEPDYARVIVRLLEAARRLDGGPEIERLVFVGDTRLLDGGAFVNLCAVSGLPGLAFIGSENTKEAEVQVEPLAANAALYLSNRWAALPEFGRYCAAQGQPIGAATAVLVDLDKTAIGARGRNASVIDQARVAAVRQTVAGLLGAAFDPEAFQCAYDLLNQPEFHPFTADNQDYLAYICLILGSGLYALESIVNQVRAGEMAYFHQFIEGVEVRRGELSPALAQVHREIYDCVQTGDPTPFKSFRRNEYRLTVGRMGFLGDDAPVDKLLAEEIVITQEVRQAALEWKTGGALLFGLSDKPDEASLPTPELAAQGFRPLHRTVTHIVGEQGLRD